jgi:predicted anti-sigma-YlaC factor YlaD
MRCSSCEPLLDEYLEGLVSPAVRTRLDEHLAECRSCRDLLAELRVIDALLIQPRRIDPAPNFTFAVMAEVRSQPPPHVPAAPGLAIFGAYLAFAWVAIAVWYFVGGAAARATLAFVATSFARFAVAVTALVGSGASLFGHATVGVSAAMGLILILDVVLGGGLALGFLVVRSRRAARFAATPEVSP